MDLRYGVNPHQDMTRAEPVSAGAGPIRVLNGAPSMINLLDALNAWPLVRELKAALGLPAAASFKHVSPAGAAVAVPLSEEVAEAYEVAGKDLPPVAIAYARARGADPKSSFGDVVALSEPVDLVTAKMLKTLVVDGIIAPGYEPEALEILAAKKRGRLLVIESDPDFEPPAQETRDVYGLRITQDANRRPITGEDLADVRCGELTDAARRDLLLGMIALKFTQSNSVGFAKDGQMIGIGAGQQSRVDCTKIAGAKADVWHLRLHPKVRGLVFKKGVKRVDRINFRVRMIEGDLLGSEERALRDAIEGEFEPLTDVERREWLGAQTGVSMVSDGFIPFRDNIDHAARHAVSYIAQPGGSIRDDEIAEACREHRIALVNTGLRLFHH